MFASKLVSFQGENSIIIASMKSGFSCFSPFSLGSTVFVCSYRADREKSILQGKLRSAQKTINEGTHTTQQSASTGTTASPSGGSLAVAADEQHRLKSRIFELENEVCVCVMTCCFSFPSSLTLFQKYIWKMGGKERWRREKERDERRDEPGMGGKINWFGL